MSGTTKGHKAPGYEFTTLRTGGGRGYDRTGKTSKRLAHRHERKVGKTQEKPESE